MRKAIKYTAFFLCIFVVYICASRSYVFSASKVRKPAVAFGFYPGIPFQLKAAVNTYLNAVPQEKVDGELVALISPHAGYIYSGPVAAYSYKLLKGKHYDTVVILAQSHSVYFSGASIYDGDYYETPLGKIPLDRKFVSYMRTHSDVITYNPQAHIKEHSIEVQLPFLQSVLGDTFNLVPIVFGDTTYTSAEAVARLIVEGAQQKNILVIASTDLSHYHPYDDAQRRDTRTLDMIMTLSAPHVYKYFVKEDGAACGKNAVITTLIYAQIISAGNVTLLKYANSGDTAGDKQKVVGYGAMAITKKGDESMESKKDHMLSQESRDELIALVKNTIREYLTTKKVSELHVENPELQAQNGAFVTFHTKSGMLRGCIGNFVSQEPLYKTIQEMALASAFRDPRFPPVTLDELDTLVVEISVLSPMKKIDDPLKIELGKEGVYIKKGFRSGTFLPQVATETGWNVEEFLGHCARDKAGIGWDGWKDADVYTYTAEVFSETR